MKLLYSNNIKLNESIKPLIEKLQSLDFNIDYKLETCLKHTPLNNILEDIFKSYGEIFNEVTCYHRIYRYIINGINIDTVFDIKDMKNGKNIELEKYDNVLPVGLKKYDKNGIVFYYNDEEYYIEIENIDTSVFKKCKNPILCISLDNTDENFVNIDIFDSILSNSSQKLVYKTLYISFNPRDVVVWADSDSLSMYLQDKKNILEYGKISDINIGVGDEDLLKTKNRNTQYLLFFKHILPNIDTRNICVQKIVGNDMDVFSTDTDINKRVFIKQNDIVFFNTLLRIYCNMIGILLIDMYKFTNFKERLPMLLPSDIDYINLDWSIIDNSYLGDRAVDDLVTLIFADSFYNYDNK